MTISLSTARNANEERFIQKIDRSGSCWIWTAGVNGSGYGTFKESGKRDPGTAHRIAYTLWVGPIPDGMVIAHRCDNRLCCNPAHLFVATRHENTLDAKNKGKFRGETKSDLKDSDVLEIRRLYDSKEAGPRALGKRYGLHENTIAAIVKRRTWRHLP